mmetsp:Transcript_6440/g.12722  ORF Transcript_6440/g.12722 Transcript_6440/m.12722 type:complete len:458 (+) Transcript_6440:232-1605(+)
MFQQNRLPLPPHRRCIQVDRMNILDRRNDKHGLHQNVLRNRPQTPRPRPSIERHLRHLLQRTLRSMELNPIHRKLKCILLNQRILRHRQNIHETLFIQPPRRYDDGETTYEFGDHAVLDEVFGYGVVEIFALDFEVVDVFFHFGAKADGGGIHAFVDDVFEAGEGSSADEEDVGGVDLDEVASGVFPSWLLGNIDDVALDDLQERMLNSLPGDIATDADISSRFANLVRFVEVNDSFLASFQILSAFEVELEQNTLNILANIPRLRQTRGIGNDQRDINQLGQCFDQQSLPGASGTDDDDVALIEFAFMGYFGSNGLFGVGDGVDMVVSAIIVGLFEHWRSLVATVPNGLSSELRQIQIGNGRFPKRRRIPIVVSSQMPLPPPMRLRMLHLHILDMVPLHRLDLLHGHPGLMMLLRLHDGDALVVIVDSDAEGDFDVALSDDVFVESFEYLAGSGEG